MTTKINTGGLKEFQYPRGHNPRLTEAQTEGIRDSYKMADKRKRREKIIMWGIIIFVVIVIGGCLLLRW